MLINFFFFSPHYHLNQQVRNWSIVNFVFLVEFHTFQPTGFETKHIYAQLSIMCKIYLECSIYAFRFKRNTSWIPFYIRNVVFIDHKESQYILFIRNFYKVHCLRIWEQRLFVRHVKRAYHISIMITLIFSWMINVVLSYDFVEGKTHIKRQDIWISPCSGSNCLVQT